MRPAGSTAVMAQRREPPDSLDYFPTPPWATRALVEEVIQRRFGGLEAIRKGVVLEPAAGGGHMAETLREYFGDVRASDIFDYGCGYAVRDFLCHRTAFEAADFVITNPPFNAATGFLLRALEVATRGVFIFVRASWLESEGRYLSIFRERPPFIVAQFVERVGLFKGRYVPGGKSATAFAWIGWLPALHFGETRYVWIPPGQRAKFERPEDIRRWCPPADAPLFDGAEQ